RRSHNDKGSVPPALFREPPEGSLQPWARPTLPSGSTITSGSTCCAGTTTSWRGCVTREGGRVVKSLGDGHICAVSSASPTLRRRDRDPAVVVATARRRVSRV